MYHFGYGSNLSIDFVKKELIPDASFVMKGYLPNFEVRFPFWSEEVQAGYSGIMEAPGEMVQGALYEVTEQALIALDNLEGVYKGRYKRHSFLVLGEDGEFHKADLYRVIDPKGPFPPSRSYVETMIAGARDLGLDPEQPGPQGVRKKSPSP
jgi:gamma-glutamylcyclotransferase (GGCT)/AIG2-like uncharacterized protein YtfP